MAPGPSPTTYLEVTLAARESSWAKNWLTWILKKETKQPPLWEAVMSSFLPFRVINSTLNDLECPVSDSARFYCFVYLAFQLQPLQIVLFKMLLPKNLHSSVPKKKNQPRKIFLNLGTVHLTVRVLADRRWAFSCTLSHTHTHTLHWTWRLVTPKADIHCIRNDRRSGKVSTAFQVYSL